MKTCIAALTLGLLVGCGGQDRLTETGSAPAAQTRKAPDESAALDSLAKANEAQAFYFNRNRRYALTFDELIESRYLKTEPGPAETGYDFKLRPAADAQTYTLLAVPATPSQTARHFFTNQTGAIHAEAGKDATAESPAVTK